MISPEARGAHDELEARLRPFIARRVPPSEVDDVMQDVFLHMQQGLPGLRNDQCLGPWLYQVARRAIVDHHRSRARHPLVVGEAEHELPDETGLDDPEASSECQLAMAVAPFVAMLPSPYREALTLTELEGLTQRQAAEMVGISLSGMKSRVQRGREQLRTLLEACCAIALDARGRVIGCEPRADGLRPGCQCGVAPGKGP